MGDVVIGLLAIVAGATLCFRGFLAMRILIPIWGALTGFSLGAGLVSAIAGDGYLSTATGWLVGFAVAIVVAGLAYLYYAISIVMLMGSAGFLLGAGAMVALGVTWNWLVILIGVGCGVALAAFAIAVDLPMLVLVLVTAFAGAMAITSGILFLAGSIATEDLTRGDVISRVNDEWWAYALYAVLTLAGIVSQIRLSEQLRLTMREAWAAPPATAGK